VKTRTLAKLIVAAASTLLCFAAIEAVVRVGCHRDADGNCQFRAARLKPYHVAVRKAETVIAKYQASKDSVLLYDPELGWTQRPGVRDHNAAGFISSNPDVFRERPKDRLRIAVFGGSYTEGTFEKGWWRVLEQTLNADGVPAEVLNFGVAGYGMDQAYLRWKRDGVPWHPQVVIFGFAAGNCYDNLNLVRMVKDPDTGVPFTKPRFLLENGALNLINSPTPAPEQIPALMRDLPSWPLLSHDAFYVPDDFRLKPWRLSRFLAFVEAKMTIARERRGMTEFYRLGAEPADLAMAITGRFAREVSESGSVFCIAHLPHHRELEDLRSNGKFQFQPMLDAVDKIAPTVHTEQALLAACGARPAEQFYVDGHYGEQLQAVVGQEIAEFVRQHAEAWRSPAK
jgi:hypothetical protein